MGNNCIAVPLYKPFNALTKDELLSLNQLYKVLGSHSIYIVVPFSLDFKLYVDHAKTNGIAINVKEFDNYFFNSIDGYNQLLLSENFYKAFSRYKFLLIYQTDAYVFRDELEYWCNKGYDYIGAPWSGNHIYENIPLVGVGNGGFSLRNVNSAVKLLKKIRMLETLEQYRNLNWKGIIPRLPVILNKLMKAKEIPCNFEKDYNWQEDVFWCKSAPQRLQNFSCNSLILKLLGKLFIKNNFKIAPEQTALQFSFETNPQALYKINNEKLPFGCHAWEKYEPDFWKAFIPDAVNSVITK